MATGDVARFMGNDADNLIGCFCLHQCARIDEHAPTIGDEGVERTIINQANLN